MKYKVTADTSFEGKIGEGVPGDGAWEIYLVFEDKTKYGFNLNELTPIDDRPVLADSEWIHG